MSEPDDDAGSEPLPPAYLAARLLVLVVFVGLATAVVALAVATGAAADLFDGLRSVDQWAEDVWPF
ncbi:hypothetical protein GCM10022251_58990 [Phytohabitans flavus]|uniref:Uncharacterized protein n=1 Tax=Phytohabitans flavus TaxID=1076124 RepID=A0A6F8XXJ9_9ACTN|nr:hypothetical protein [Phytohabitans flavus]BCB78555.1 hypothetical protein Pflav_049650 [Phytohabitans flavus]